MCFQIHSQKQCFARGTDAGFPKNVFSNCAQYITLSFQSSKFAAIQSNCALSWVQVTGLGISQEAYYVTQPCCTAHWCTCMCNSYPNEWTQFPWKPTTALAVAAVHASSRDVCSLIDTHYSYLMPILAAVTSLSCSRLMTICEELSTNHWYDFS